MITVVNKSTLVSDADVQLMVGACAHQLRYHAQPHWRLAAMPVIFAASAETAPVGSYVIALLDDADQAGDLGWHTEAQGGVVYGEVFTRPVLDNGGDALTRNLSIASVLSHEVVETYVDPHAVLWADDAHGHLYALEVADPVESDAYRIIYGGAAVTVSNFVTPAWFDPNAPAGSRFDWMRHVTAPFTMSPGGYVIKAPMGSETQQFGDTLPSWRRGMKRRPGARAVTG